MRDRGKALESPGWWLDEVRPRLQKERGLVELGKALAKLVGRSTPWSHTVLSKFGKGETEATQELAVALSIYFDVPRPFFIPTSLREAKAIQAVADIQPSSSIDADARARVARRNRLDAGLKEFEREARPRRDDLHSGDEASRASPRGPRRVPRGGQ